MRLGGILAPVASCRQPQIQVGKLFRFVVVHLKIRRRAVDDLKPAIIFDQIANQQTCSSSSICERLEYRINDL